MNNNFPETEKYKQFFLTKIMKWDKIMNNGRHRMNKQ